MPKRVISSTRIHRSALPFAPATVAGGFLFAACVGTDRDGRLAVGDARAQTRQCLDNIRALIEETGGTLADVVKCTVYVTGREHWQPMNEAYFAYFGDDQPHRVSCIVAGLGDPACLVEIDATAYLGTDAAAGIAKRVR